MSKLSVLHVGKFYPPVPGGMERVVQSLCEGERPKIDSRVLVANDRRSTVRETVNGVHVTRVGSLGAIGSVGVCPTFPLELGRARRDLTVIHEPNPIALVSDWAAAERGPLVVWFHSEVVRPRWKYRLMYRPFLHRVLARASRIVVSSPRLAEHAVELQPFRAKCVVIPFGIDTARLDRSPGIDGQVASIASAVPGPRILFAGRLVAYKGVDVLVRAMRDVNATALIVGEGPARAELETLAEACGVAGRVSFLGRLPEAALVAHLHACDVFVLPSVTRAETFGVVQLEAMACGKPVVSTDLPTGVPWVNRHQETGLVIPPADAAALASALRRLLGDDALRLRLGAGARIRVEEEFTVDRMAAQSTALYEELVRTGAAQPAVAAAAGEIKV